MSQTLMYGVTLTVEAALSASTGTYAVWDVDVWDDGLWGPDEIWVDITAYVRSINTSRRFSRDLQAWEAGTATLVLDNLDGRFSPSNLDGPYVDGDITQVRPWRPVRIIAEYDGISYPVYRGYALAWQESYVDGFEEGGDAFVTVPCTDELGSLARFDGLEMTPAGAGELSGQRIHRVLDNAGHTGDRAIDEGTVTLQATTLASNCVTELKLTADSEGGAVWVEADGTVVFADQYSLIESTRSRVNQATYGDVGGSEIPYSDIELAYDGDLLANIAAFARTGGTAQVVDDPSSRALYGDRRYSRTDLVCETDAQVELLAEVWIARYSQPEQRVTRIQLKPRNTPATMFPEVLGRQVRDLVQVKRRPPGGHTITHDCHIAGISHTITAGNWITDIDLWSARPWVDYTSSLWDVGVWDEAIFFFG